jgi:hypothetical protein
LRAHRFCVLLDIVIRETKNGPTKLLQMLLSTKVFMERLLVVSAVNLNNKHLGWAREVGEPRTDCVMPTKFQAA